MTAAVAVLAAGAATALLVRGRPTARLAGRPRPRAPRPDARGVLVRPRTAPVGAVAIALVVGVGAGPVPALAAALVAHGVLLAGRDAAAQSLRDEAAAGWREALRAAAAALRAGTVLPVALRRGAAASGCAPVAARLHTAAATTAMGGDPLTALGETGPGGQLAAVLALAAQVGAQPAALATRLADALAAGAEAQRAALVALAGVRATTRLLAALPLAGVALAGAFGASAPAFLLGTAPGHACVLLAAGFEAVGLAWTRRLLAAA